MPKGTNQKLKLYYLGKIMTEKTDDEHSLTMPEIQQALAEYEVTAERKSLYDDLETLRLLGIDIIGRKEGKSYVYHVGKKKFDIAELKLLVDAVQSSKFITEKKSRELIKKITEFASEYEATQLKRQVVVQGRVKTMNESIYYIVDCIHKAISENRQIIFEYMRWNTDKQMEPRREKPYTVSPWVLTWTDENYYMIAYDTDEGKIKHFRVDKMRDIELASERRLGRIEFQKFDIARYAKMNFGMYHGDDTKVKIAFVNDLAGVFIDRFGKDIPIRPYKRKGWSETMVDVAVSDQFLGWIFALGTKVKLVEPEKVTERYQCVIEAIRDFYINNK